MKQAQVGLIITLLGFFLFFGNIFGFFKTFPFAGSITIAIGGGLMKEDE